MNDRAQILRALAVKLEELAFSASELSELKHLKKAYAALNLASTVYAPCNAASGLDRAEAAFALVQVVLARFDSRCAAWDFDLEIIEENLMVLLGAEPIA